MFICFCFFYITLGAEDKFNYNKIIYINYIYKFSNNDNLLDNINNGEDGPKLLSKRNIGSSIIGWKFGFVLLGLMAFILIINKNSQNMIIPTISINAAAIYFILLIFFTLGLNNFEALSILGICLFTRYFIIMFPLKENIKRFQAFLRSHKIAIGVFCFFSILSLTSLINIESQGKILMLLAIYAFLNLLNAIFFEKSCLIICNEAMGFDPKKRILNFFIFMLFLIFFSFFCFYLPFSLTNADSARYLLSTLSQIEATILTVAVALSLVIIQIDSSSYSMRILDVMKKSPYLWINLIAYIIVITGTLWILKAIPGTDSNKFLLENEIIIAYRLGLLSFLSLIPFIWFVFNLLNPISKIDLVFKDINLINFLKSNDPGDNNDPFKLLTDLIIGSIKKNDDASVEYGLDALDRSIINLYSEIDNNLRDKTKFFKYIFIYIKKIGKISILKQDEISCISTLAAIKSISMQSLEKMPDKEKEISLSEDAADCLGELGELIAGVGFKIAFQEVSNVLREIGEKAAAADRERAAVNCIEALEKISIEGLNNGYKIIRNINYIEFVCKASNNLDLYFSSFTALKNIARRSARRRIDGLAPMKHSIISIKRLIITSPEQDPELALYGLKCIRLLGVEAAKLDIEKIVILVIEILNFFIKENKKYNLNPDILDDYIDEIKGLGKDECK